MNVWGKNIRESLLEVKKSKKKVINVINKSNTIFDEIGIFAGRWFIGILYYIYIYTSLFCQIKDIYTIFSVL